MLDRRPPVPSGDKLDRVNLALREVRDLELRIKDLEAELTERRKLLNDLQHQTLPDLFSEAQIKRLTLAAEGNLPAYDAQLRPYYKAGIPADWDEPRREEGFRALVDAGGEDLIRTVIEVELPPGDAKVARRIEEGLKRLNVKFRKQLTVHWKTLTSFVQEQYEAEPPRVLPLEKLGAVVGRKVTIKPETKTWRKQ